MNQTAEDILHQVASNIHDSNLMKRYVINLAKADREKWQLSEVDKVALVVFPVLAYYTGKYHLNDTMTFLWAMAFMPIFVLSAIWGINELAAYLERRKKKPESRR